MRLNLITRLSSPRLAALFLSGAFCFPGHPSLRAGEVVNLGMGGHSSEMVLRRFDEVLKEKGDVLVLMVGTNDAVNTRRLTTPEVYRRSVLEMVGRARAAGIAVILVTPPPCVESVVYQRHEVANYGGISPTCRLQNVRDTLRELAQAEKVPLIDFHALLEERKLVSDGPDSVVRAADTRDGVHLTSRGYALLAGLVRDELRQRGWEKSAKIVCAGDSLTLGSHMIGQGTNCGETYPAILKSLLPNPPPPPPIEVINAGAEETIPDLLNRFTPAALAAKPDAIVVTLGMPDLAAPSPTPPFERLRQALTAMIAQAREHGVPLILITPAGCVDAVLHARANMGKDKYGALPPSARFSQAAEMVRKVGRAENVPVVDFHAFLHENGRVSEEATSLIRNRKNGQGLDGLAPTEAGNRALAQLVYTTLQSTLKTTPKRVVCFGDNLTFGRAHLGTGTACGTTYPAFLSRLLNSTAAANPAAK